MTFDEYFKKYNGVGIDYDGKWSYQCFTENHFVLMENMTYKAIQDIEVGDRVVGYDNRINTVLQTHKRKANVIKVRTNLGDIIVTENHPFFFKDGSFDSILKGSEKPFAVYDKIEYAPSGLTNNELLFLGFWLGDGSLARYHDNRKDEIKVTYGESKRDFINSLGIITNIQPHTSGNNSFNASIRKREHPLLTEIIYMCYNEKKEKVLPLIFNNRELELIIKGYTKADGSENNNSYAITSTSKSLLLSVQAAAIVCGYSTSSIRPLKRSGEPIIIKGKEVKNIKPIWRMTLSKRSKNVHNQIQRVEYLGEKTVYNIGTDGTHTYICDNYKVHNCFDLANDYCVKVLGGKAFVGMYAWEIYENFNNQPSKNLFTRIANTPDFVPQKGDIIVWAKSLNGKAGHVAICDGVGDTTYFYSYEENWDGKCHPTERVKHNYNHVLGVLRPKDQSMITGTKTETKGEKTMSTVYYGIDVSQHNGAVDMAKVKASGKNFVMIRSSYGNVAAYPNQKDTRFAENVTKAKAAGLDFGIYHYSYATTVSGMQAEAKGFVKLLDSIKPIPYFVALDIEESVQYNLNTDTLQSIIKAFIDVVEGAGYFCALYSYESFLNKLPANFRNKYAIWCANITKSPAITYGVHQYSFTGKVNGISGDVDLNQTTIDYPTIIKNAGLNGFTKPVTTTTTTTEIKTLDSAGFKKGDKGYQALALKSLLKLAVDKKIVDGKMDDTSGIGNGCVKVINSLLGRWGYKQNGIAGTNFINKLYKELK